MMSDQTVKSDSGKPKLTLVPRRIIFAIARVREYGNDKYPEGGPDNWKQVEKERYQNAAFRHFMAYLDKPDGVDEESGLPHLWHLACNIAFLCEMEDLVAKTNEESERTEGHWIFRFDENEFASVSLAECSVCGGANLLGLTKYCPVCGSRMWNASDIEMEEIEDE